MDDRTLAALKASIEHWEQNARAEKPLDAYIQSGACALCFLFLKRKESSRPSCRGCPVSKKTRLNLCKNTPWEEAKNALHLWYNDDGQDTSHHRKEQFQAAARAEVDFLKSLLPDEAREANAADPLSTIRP